MKSILILGGGGVLVLAVGFMLVSLGCTFSNWPWTTSRSLREGDVVRFQEGETKERSLERAIDYQRSGMIGAVRPLGMPPTTSSEKFKGTDLSVEDLAALNPADKWHVGLTEGNSWLEIQFNGDRLTKITRKDYHGPTE